MKLPVTNASRRNRTDAAICAHRVEPDPAVTAERYGAGMTVPDWHARLVSGEFGSRSGRPMLTGTVTRLQVKPVLRIGNPQPGDERRRRCRATRHGRAGGGRCHRGLSAQDFDKLMPSELDPTIRQDVYKPGGGGRELYVKFTCDARGQLLLISFKDNEP